MRVREIPEIQEIQDRPMALGVAGRLPKIQGDPRPRISQDLADDLPDVSDVSDVRPHNHRTEKFRDPLSTGAQTCYTGVSEKLGYREEVNQMDKVRQYIVKTPLDQRPLGTERRVKPSGAVVTVTTLPDCQVWTFDYTGSRF